MAMTYDEACEKAYIWHKQGIPYQSIADQLKAAGYVSKKTGSPVTSMTSRLMAMAYEKQEQQDLKEDKKTEAKIVVTSPVRDVLSAIGKILDLDGIPDSTKISLAKSLIQGQSQTASEPKKNKGGRPRKNPALNGRKS